MESGSNLMYDRALLKIKRKLAINVAMNFRNIRYYKGDGVTTPITNGDDPIFGFTCSGLICEVLRQVGLMAHNERLTAIKIYRKFQDKEVKGPPKRGDLLFYGTMPAGAEPELIHIAMMIDDWHQIEAGGGNSDTDTDEEAAKRNAFVRIRPVEFRENERVAVCRIWE